MSNKYNTPDIEKNSNFYRTPIKKKRIDFINDNNKSNENYEENLSLTGQILQNLGNYEERRQESNTRKFENDLFLASNHKKFFNSPFSNFLFHSPISFQNYLNLYSKEPVNVLNLVQRRKFGGFPNRDFDNLGEFEKPNVNNNEELERDIEKEKIRTPFKIHSNLIESKYVSPNKSNEKSNLLNNCECKNIYLDKKMSSEKKKKIKIIQEDKENIFQDINLKENESDVNLPNSNTSITRKSPNLRSNCNHMIINVNTFLSNSLRNFENHKTPFKNLSKDLNNISKDVNFLLANTQSSDSLDSLQNFEEKNKSYIKLGKIQQNTIIPTNVNSFLNTSLNYSNINPINLQSPVIIKNKIIIDNKCESEQKDKSILKDYLTPLRFSSSKKRIFECTEETGSTTLNTTQKKIKMKKRLRKTSGQLEYLEETYKNNKDWTKQIIYETALKTGLSQNKVYKWLWDQKNKEIMEKKHSCIFQVQSEINVKNN